jgi:hypothetical protein
MNFILYEILSGRKSFARRGVEAAARSAINRPTQAALAQGQACFIQPRTPGFGLFNMAVKPVG